MLLIWHIRGWDDYQYWQEHDRKIVTRINELIKDMLRHPFTGIGKPEPLRNKLKGAWSRRITEEHRLVYRIDGEGEERRLTIIQCRYHH